MKRPLFKLLITLGALSAATTSASAEPLGFSCLSNNNAANCAVLETQIDVLIGQTADSIFFRFSNDGLQQSFLDGVYFSDPPPSLLGGLPTFSYSGSGIKFSVDCAPGDLPNHWGTTYCADADAPAAKNGVNPGEWMQVSYHLLSPATTSVADVLARIAAGTFDIGIKVQGFSNGGSEWGGVNRPPPPPPTEVPEPGSLVLLATALTAVCRAGRNRAS